MKVTRLGGGPGSITCNLRHRPSPKRSGIPPTTAKTQFQRPAFPSSSLSSPRLRSGVRVASSAASASDAAFPSPSSAVDEKQRALTTAEWINAFVKFTRPHTMIGTCISVCSVSLMAIHSPLELSMQAFGGLMQSLVSALLMNVAIVGLNQLYDVEIDKVNKPYLPLASGEFSMETGQRIVTACAVLSMVLGVASASIPLIGTLAASWILGYLYSADHPLLRWKRFPVLAASCILAVRAVLVQLGFYYHMRACVSGGGLTGLAMVEPSMPLLFTVAFMFVFSIVIALFKDIPDIKGDTEAGLKTLSVRLGSRTVLNVCLFLLSMCYLSAAAFSWMYLTPGWTQTALIGGHLVMLAFLWLRASKTDAQDPKSIYKLYMDVWAIFYAEYLLVPLFR